MDDEAGTCQRCGAPAGEGRSPFTVRETWADVLAADLAAADVLARFARALVADRDE